MKQRGKIYQCCVRLVLLYCCETWERTVADEARLHGMERRTIRMMCVMRLVDMLLTDVLQGRVGVVVKIKDMIIQSFCGGIVMSSIDISSPKYLRL